MYFRNTLSSIAVFRAYVLSLQPYIFSQTPDSTQTYFKSEMRATDLEDRKSWKAAEDNWLKFRVEKGWAHCLKTEHST